MTKKCLLFILFCLCFKRIDSAETHYLQEKFRHASPGEYIVTVYENTCSLLILRSLSSDILILEEISVPLSQLNLKTIKWSAWLSQKAPGHTAWTLYEIDLKKGQVIECFSYSKNGWIYLENQEQFFAKLLTLPFLSVSDSEKKKIGPSPAAGETDHRKIWNPPLVIEGKKIDKPSFDVLRTRWPDDSSPLALCHIDLYFDASHPHFPFPYWIEVQSPHYAFKMRSIESGHNLTSPMALQVPRRPPVLLGPAQKTQTIWTIPLRAALYHEAVHLFAIDLSEPHPPISIPHRLERQSHTEQTSLLIHTSDLKNLLNPHHRYRWAILSDKTPSVYVNSEETFTWRTESYEHEFPQ